MSAPEWLRGRYSQFTNYRGQGVPPRTDEIEVEAKTVDMTTMCVRNTEQCWALATATYDGATAEWPLVFAGGKWSVSRRASRDHGCPNHTETFHFKSSSTRWEGAATYDAVLERIGG